MSTPKMSALDVNNLKSNLALITKCYGDLHR